MTKISEPPSGRIGPVQIAPHESDREFLGELVGHFHIPQGTYQVPADGVHISLQQLLLCGYGLRRLTLTLKPGPSSMFEGRSVAGRQCCLGFIVRAPRRVAAILSCPSVQGITK